MADKFDEFLEEVENDIRQERFQKLWEQYGKRIIAAIIGVFVLTGGYMAWQNYQHKQYQLYSEQFIGAQDLISQGKNAEAIGVMRSLSQVSHKSYAVLAKFSQASLYAQEGPNENFTTSKEIYESIAKDSKVDKSLRDLATFFLVNMKVDEMQDFRDQKSLDEFLRDLEPLTHQDNPWHNLANELKGFILYKQNNLASASEIFVALAQDQKTPDNMRLRAQLMSQTIATQMQTSEPEKKA
jgi:hypothetical protein